MPKLLQVWQVSGLVPGGTPDPPEKGGQWEAMLENTVIKLHYNLARKGEEFLKKKKRE